MEIFDSLTARKQKEVPLDETHIRMYVCGMTVYDFCHVGHARAMVVFDIVYRHLCHVYGEDKVTYVRNITDIDDKIIARANEKSQLFSDLTEHFINEMHADAKALNILDPDDEPRATIYMPQIIDMIQALSNNGFTYQADNGDVYFEVSKYADYGKLSHRDLEDMEAGARVQINTAKRDPHDFVLWKAAKPDEPHWDSPWGIGRPGWHIECSAMSTQCLGNHFDIHGGGMDLKFPHHENEIAQSCCATGEDFVNVWMHNGHVRIDDTKMSKSLGNFFTIREVLDKYDGEVIRYFILTSHYRSPLNYSDKQLDNAKQSLDTLYTALRGITATKADPENDYRQRFMAAMDDDFSTPIAQAVLFELAKEINKLKDSEPDKAAVLAGELIFLGNQLGLLAQEPEAYFKGGEDTDVDAAQIESLIEQRNAARAAKDFATSDKIRDQLDEMGVVLEDKAGSTSWRLK